MRKELLAVMLLKKKVEAAEDKLDKAIETALPIGSNVLCRKGKGQVGVEILDYATNGTHSRARVMNPNSEKVYWVYVFPHIIG